MGYPSYDEKRTERPVRLERTEGTVVIEGRAYPAKEIVEALAQTGYSEIRANGDSLILGRKRISPIYKSRKERAMASLCHESLAYCCPLTKRCAERDRALEIMGLTKEDYNQLKGNAHHQFMDSTKPGTQFGSHESSWSVERPANQPATDRGFGSDDYRRDFETLDRAMQSGQPLDGSRRWNREDERSEYHTPESQFSSRPSGNPFTDVAMDGSLIDEMRAATRELTESSSCNVCSDPSVDGIGSLFTQGELSPFKEEPRRDGLSFCFSCGRTFDPGTKMCTFCGATQ